MNLEKPSSEPHEGHRARSVQSNPIPRERPDPYPKGIEEWPGSLAPFIVLISKLQSKSVAFRRPPWLIDQENATVKSSQA